MDENIRRNVSFVHLGLYHGVYNQSVQDAWLYIMGGTGSGNLLGRPSATSHLIAAMLWVGDLSCSRISWVTSMQGDDGIETRIIRKDRYCGTYTCLWRW